MKIYKLYGPMGTYFVGECYEVDGFYLVPVVNSYEYTSYAKALYKCEVVLDQEGKRDPVQS
jgi:hypothetical protein